MAEILFYHLTESTLDEALPGLVERSLGRGWRVTIQAVSEERRDALDNLLWTFSDTSFVAHGTDKEPHPEQQPVLLTTSEANPNGATVRFLVEGLHLLRQMVTNDWLSCSMGMIRISLIMHGHSGSLSRRRTMI